MKKIVVFLTIACITIIIVSNSCKNVPPPPPPPFIVNNNSHPVAKAGNDTTIILPANQVKLDGTGSYDPNNDSITYEWTRLNGPSAYTIENPDSLITNVTNLVQGIYEFTLTVKDSKGATGVDKVIVNVNPAPPPPPGNRPPLVSSGHDLIIQLPEDSGSLYGNVYDPDNNIATIQWTKIAGPPSVNIVMPGSAYTSITNLERGVYKFEIKVVDSAGLSAKDTSTVIVGELPANPEEIILENQSWSCHWDCYIQINEFYNHIPADKFFKVFIKRDNSGNWQEVVSWEEMTTLSIYGFVLQKETLWIHQTFHSGFDISDTPDIKIVY